MTEFIEKPAFKEPLTDEMFQDVDGAIMMLHSIREMDHECLSQLLAKADPSLIYSNVLAQLIMNCLPLDGTMPTGAKAFWAEVGE